MCVCLQEAYRLTLRPGFLFRSITIKETGALWPPTMCNLGAAGNRRKTAFLLSTFSVVRRPQPLLRHLHLFMHFDFSFLAAANATQHLQTMGRFISSCYNQSRGRAAPRLINSVVHRCHQGFSLLLYFISAT